MYKLPKSQFPPRFRLLAALLSILASTIFFTGCGDQEKPAEKISREIPPLKEVEIFKIDRDRPELSLNKIGTVESTVIANLSPQITGKITDIKVQLGQKVKAGQILLTLGDSLQIDLTEQQLHAASQSLDLAQNSQNISNELNEGNYSAAQIGVKNAAEAYKKALHSKENAEVLFENQQESAELGIDTAENALKAAKKNYNNLSDSIDDLEDQYGNLKKLTTTDSKTLSELQKSIDQLESQLVNAKFARENAENSLEQAELGIDQSEENFQIQQEQLDFAIESAYLQYQAAVIQARNANKAGQLQKIGGTQQILQINNGLETAALTLAQTQLKSPIDGTVTAINAKENNPVNPGQTLITIENISSPSITTSLNEAEAGLLSPKTEVRLRASDGNEIPAQIAGISPTPDGKNKKFEVKITTAKQNSPSALLPGSLINVIFNIQSPDKIFIPLNSLVLDEGKKLVPTLDSNNRVQLAEVQTGQIVGDFIEILKGLTGHETIIKSSLTSIEAGERIISK